MDKLLLLLPALALATTDPNKPHCGVATFDPSTGAEHLAAEHEFPWVVSLQYKNAQNVLEHYCTGTILSPEWVVTAKSCFNVTRFTELSVNPYTDVVVVAGKHALNSSEETGQTSKVEYLIVANQQNDVVILKLATRLNFFGNKVRPICMHKLRAHDAARPVECYLSGWGDTSEGSSFLPKKLRMTRLPDTECLKFSRPFEDSFCAGPMFHDKPSPCWGDIGASLMCHNNGRYYMEGVLIVLTSVTCNKPYTPVIFADLDDIILHDEHSNNSTV